MKEKEEEAEKEMRKFDGKGERRGKKKKMEK